MVNGLNSPAIRAPVVGADCPPSAWISSRARKNVSTQEIATIPVEYARRPRKDASTMPIAANSREKQGPHQADAESGDQRPGLVPDRRAVLGRRDRAHVEQEQRHLDQDQ